MIRRLLSGGLLWAICGVACGPIVVPAAPPTAPVRALPLGLNDGFHGPLPPDIVARYCGTTIRTPQLSVEGLLTYYASIASCPSMRTIVLVEAPDVALVHALAPLLHEGDALELGNELELSPFALTEAQFGAFLTAACVPHAITGGVYTLDADTKSRLLAAHVACPSARLGVHLYQPLSAADLAWLAARPVPVVVTETGYPTRCDPARDAQQLQYLRTQQALLSTVPTIDLLVIYQRPVGPSCSDVDTFGIAGHLADALVAHP